MRNQLKPIPFVAVLFFTVSGGPYGIEPAVSSMGPGLCLLLFILTPIIWSVPIALMVAELSAAMPVEGGYYYWVKEGLGPFWGFQEAWWSWFFAAIDMAIYPVLFGDYIKYFWPELGDGAKWLIGLGVISSSLVINLRGATSVGKSALLVGLFTALPFLLLFMIGVPKINHQPWRPFAVSKGELMSTLSLGLATTMWNYQGWDNVSTFAGEVADPQRTFPRALAITVPLVALFYLAALIPSLGATADWPRWKEGDFPKIAGQISGHWLAVMMAAGALGSSWALFNSQLLYSSRLPFVLAKEGYLPRALALENRYNVPWVSLLACSIVYAALARLNFQTLVVINVLIYSCALVLEFAALIALRRNRADLDRPFKIPGGRWGLFITSAVPMIPVIIVTAATFAWLEKTYLQLFLCLGMVLSGLILYVLHHGRSKKASREATVK